MSEDKQNSRFSEGGIVQGPYTDGPYPDKPEVVIPQELLPKINTPQMGLTLDAIIARAIPILPSDCKIKKAQKEALRLLTKRDIALLITRDFIPRSASSTSNVK